MFRYLYIHYSRTPSGADADEFRLPNIGIRMVRISDIQIYKGGIMEDTIQTEAEHTANKALSFIGNYPNRIEFHDAVNNKDDVRIFEYIEADRGFVITPQLQLGITTWKPETISESRYDISLSLRSTGFNLNKGTAKLFIDNKELFTLNQENPKAMCDNCVNSIACRVSGTPMGTSRTTYKEHPLTVACDSFAISKQAMAAKYFDMKLTDDKFINRFLSYYADVPIADVWAMHKPLFTGNDVHMVGKLMHIPKKNNKIRVVCAPSAKLKKVLSVLYKNFLMPLEFEKEYAETVTAFRQDSGIVFNGQKHAGKDVLISVDLSNFFHSVDYKMIRKFLGKYYGEPAAHYMANLMTLKMPLKTYQSKGCFNGKRKVAPQGFPTSPAIANLIGYELLDKVIKPALGEALSVLIPDMNNYDYTRYADDVTISFNTGLDHRDIGDKAAKVLCELIKTTTPFIVNERKVKVMPKTSRQYCCGIVVNEKVNIMKQRYKKDRAMVDYFYKGRLPFSSYKEVMGRVSFGLSVAPTRYIPLKNKLMAGRSIRMEKYKEGDQDEAA